MCGAGSDGKAQPSMDTYLGCLCSVSLLLQGEPFLPRIYRQRQGRKGGSPTLAEPPHSHGGCTTQVGGRRSSWTSKPSHGVSWGARLMIPKGDRVGSRDWSGPGVSRNCAKRSLRLGCRTFSLASWLPSKSDPKQLIDSWRTLCPFHALPICTGSFLSVSSSHTCSQWHNAASAPREQ